MNSITIIIEGVKNPVKAITDSAKIRSKNIVSVQTQSGKYFEIRRLKDSEKIYKKIKAGKDFSVTKSEMLSTIKPKHGMFKYFQIQEEEWKKGMENIVALFMLTSFEKRELRGGSVPKRLQHQSFLVALSLELKPPKTYGGSAMAFWKSLTKLNFSY